jgi:hypothetical protein
MAAAYTPLDNQAGGTGDVGNGTWAVADGMPEPRATNIVPFLRKIVLDAVSDHIRTPTRLVNDRALADDA